MMQIRRGEERGHFNHGWLDTYHTFSFADYHDPNHMGFRTLRVINQDRLQPGTGFPTHGHRDMEIISYVLAGSLQHRDSMGNGSIIRAGDVQRMTAGTGVTHSEFNASRLEPVHFLQLWIVPERRGLEPGYEQRHYAPEEKQGRLRLIASREGRDGSVRIHQDANIYAALLGPAQGVTYSLPSGRAAWLQVAWGSVALNEHPLKEGDGAAWTGNGELQIVGREASQILLFDLAG